MRHEHGVEVGEQDDSVGIGVGEDIEQCLER
jgi:hypothetical protein